MMHQYNLQNIFSLPLSKETCLQYCELDIIIQSLQGLAENDRWTYIWGNDSYSSTKAYKQFTGSQQVHPAFQWLWTSSCQPKYKGFFLASVEKKLNTRSLLSRKNMQLELYDCELCLLLNEKKLRHLFFKCPFAKNC
jgi:hypothetical protein